MKRRPHTHRGRALGLSVACAVLATMGCGRFGFDARPAEAGEDAGTDAGPGVDGGRDAAVPERDGGETVDGGMAGPDAGPGDPRNLSYLWHAPIASGNGVELVGLAADDESVYVAFGFSREVSFLGRDLTALSDGLVVARQDKADGSIRWLNFYENGAVPAIWGLAVGSGSQIFIAGNTRTSLDLGGRVIAGMYYAALDAEDGATLWARSGGSNTIEVRDVASDEAGNLYLAGEYSAGSLAGRSPMGRDAFIQSYDPAGTLRWTRFVSGTGAELVQSLAVGAGRVVIAGVVDDGADLGDGTPISIPRRQAHVTALNATDGAHQWSRVLSSDGTAYALHGLAVDSLGRIYVGGSFSTNLDAGGAVLTAARTDAFLAAYDATGTHRWSRALEGGDGNTDVWSLVTDREDNLYVGGEFSYSIDFGGPVETGVWSDGFAAVYSPEGVHLWHLTYGGSERDQVLELEVDSAGRLFMGGSFEGSPDLGGGTLVSDRGGDYYIAAFEPWLP